MRRLIGILCGLILMAEGSTAAPQWAFRVHFTDKTGSPALSAPAAFLSARALQRRSTQGVSVIDEDRPVSPTYLNDVLAATGGKLHTTSRWLNQCVILLNDSSQIAQLQSKTFVSGIDYLGYFATALHNVKPGNPVSTTPYTPTAYRGTGTAAYYGNTWNQTSMVNGDYLHDQGFTGQGQLIAVLDLGFNGTDTHPGFDSLRNQGRLLDTWNFVNASNDIYSPAYDHGTSVLSTMAGIIPGTFVGSAPHAQYALYLTEDNSITDAMYELDNFVAGLERADSIGADIITSSLGYFDFVHPLPYYIYPKADINGHTTVVAKAVNTAVAKGIFAVITAGNEGGSSWNFILTPGDADSALTVGAVQATRTIAGFSGPGPSSSGRIKPDVVAQGSPAAAFANTGFANLNGTSFSTPQIAGWAACVRQFKPGVSPYLLRKAITICSDRAGNPTSQEGYGIPDFKKVLGTVGIAQVPGLSHELTILPNPFSTVIHLQLTVAQATDVVCTLTDVSGRIVVTQALHATASGHDYMLTPPATLPAGSYFLQTMIGQEVLINKLVKR